jgi:hypothetical protein
MSTNPEPTLREPTAQHVYDELVLLREAIRDLIGAQRAVLSTQTTIINALPARRARR